MKGDLQWPLSPTGEAGMKMVKTARGSAGISNTLFHTPASPLSSWAWGASPNRGDSPSPPWHIAVSLLKTQSGQMGCIPPSHLTSILPITPLVLLSLPSSLSPRWPYPHFWCRSCPDLVWVAFLPPQLVPLPWWQMPGSSVFSPSTQHLVPHLSTYTVRLNKHL